LLRAPAEGRRLHPTLDLRPLRPHPPPRTSLPAQRASPRSPPTTGAAIGAARRGHQMRARSRCREPSAVSQAQHNDCISPAAASVISTIG
jgi:hypothetical protein